MNAREVLVRQLEPILERERTARRRMVVGIGVMLLAVVGFVFWHVGMRSAWVFVGLPCVAAALYLIARVWASEWVPDLKLLARRIEDENPELNSLLITAVEQDDGGEIGYLQERVVIEAVQEAIARDWSESVSRTQARFSRVLEIGGAVALMVVWVLFFPKVGPDGGLTGGGMDPGEETVEEEDVVEPGEVAVEPGDVEVERGSRLVVRARFSAEDIPGEAALVVAKHDGTEQRVAMSMALGDPVFTAVLESVDEDMDYRVEYAERASDEFKIDTYVLPALERSDVTVVQPEWVGGGEKTKKDSLRASVAEGGSVKFEFHLNKVVKEALLVPVAEKGQKTAEGEAIVLGGGAIIAAPMVPEESRKWRLRLVDEDGRENRDKPLVSVTVKRNLPPKIELAFPKGDVDATPVQEVPLEASFWDDYGVVSAGLKFRFKGEEQDVAFETVSFKPDTKNAASTMLELESLGAKPNDLVTYHFYAEDESVQGDLRRVESDMFFVEVRHFEEIFREGAGGESGQQQQQEQGQAGEQGGVAGQLLEAQKDVINATWKVRREGEAMRGEIPVLKAGQEEVVVLAEEAGGDVQDELLLKALDSAKAAMGEAIEALGDEELRAALEHEQTAYGHLLAMRAREFEIQQQSQSQSQSQSQQQQQRQRQLMQMDMKEEEDRYETAKFAQEQQQEQQMGEDAAILSRLKELAQRQEAIAEKLKELEAAMAAAEEEEEIEELERQLKRLRDEQRELLEDMDAVAEKMDEEENRARTSEAREQLEEARENAQAAAEKMQPQEGQPGEPQESAQEQVAQAANEATRASEQLDELQDEFRAQSASAFGEAMREMREEVRELARNEEKLAEAIEEGVKQQGNADFEARAAAAEIAKDIREQKEAVEDLLESMGEVSDQAEAGETLLAQKLYDALREAKTGGLEEALDEAATRVGWGRFGQAAEEEEKARGEIEKLQAAVENAAESVLGDEAAGLRAARDELERLREEMEERGREVSGEGSSDQVASEEGRDGEAEGRGEGESEGELAQRGEGRGEGERPGEEPGEGEGETSGEGQGEGEVAQEGREGEPPGRGAGEGQEGQGQEGQGEGQEGQGEMAQGTGEQPGEGQEGQEGHGQGQGQQPGQGRGEGEGQEVAEEGEGEGRGQGQQPGQGSGGRGGGGDGSEEVAEGGEPEEREGEAQEGRGNGGQPRRTGRFFESWTGFAPQTGGGGNRVGPLDEAFEDWADRLRDVEEMVGSQELREEVQRAREAAKELRQKFGERHSEAPEWDLVEMELVEPLERLERAVREELAKRTEPDALAPVDRDPVPRRFEELVRKYYEELGSGY